MDADRLALIRLEYKNIQNIRDFSLLGVSFKEDLREVVIQFKKQLQGNTVWNTWTSIPVLKEVLTDP